jgi:cell division transport system permease protein
MMDILSRLLRETFIGFRSSPLLSTLSILTLTFTLFLLGLFYLFHVNLNQVIVEMDRRVQLVIYLRDDVSRDEVEKIRIDLFQREEVRSAKYISKEDALNRFREELGEESFLLEGLSVNPLPASIEVDFKEGYFDDEIILSLAKVTEGHDSVESVDSGGMWLGKLQLVRTLITIVGSVGGTVLLVVAMVIIGSAIRMTVFSRKTELLVMKIVGSADWTIEGPFLIEGLIKGAVGGVVAVVLSYGVYYIVDSRLIGLIPFPSLYGFVVILIGILLSTGGTYLSVKGQLRKLW